MGRINIEIADELHKKVKVACALKDSTLIKFINEAVKEKLEKKK